MNSSIDPFVLAMLGYLCVMLGSDRYLRVARAQLSNDEKLRLVDGFNGLWPVSYLPIFGWVVLLGVGLNTWSARAVIASYVFLVGLSACEVLLFWRRIHALEIDEGYLKAWRVWRSLRFLAMAGIFGYIIHLYAS